MADKGQKSPPRFPTNSTQLAEKIVKASQDALGEERSNAKQAPAKKADIIG